MELSVRQKQTEAVVRMLNLNNPVAIGATADSEVYKLLVLDKVCRDIISPLLKVSDLRRHGVTLHLMLETERQNIPDVPAVYFVQPNKANIQRILQDAARGVYEKFHLNFASSLPRQLLEELAGGALRSDSLHRFVRVFDQFVDFVSLDACLFSLAQPDVYLCLNDPSARDADVEAAIEAIVNGLFCVLVTLGVVPVIRCPEKGPAEMVGRQLDARIRAHLAAQNNLFKEAGPILHRPLLCLLDRNFELEVGVQHAWTYRPLVHDVLNMKLNRVTLPAAGGGPAAAAAAATAGKGKGTSYELDEQDSFWTSHAASPFPKAAEEVDLLLKRWKQDKEEVNRGGDGGSEVDLGDDLMSNTKKLTAAMNAVPEMVERKRVIDKHISIGGALLEEIKTRALDGYFTTEEELLMRGTVDRAGLLDLLRSKGTKEDKLRLAIVDVLVQESSTGPEVEAVDAVLREAEVDRSALHYVKQLKRINSSLAQAGAFGSDKGNKDDLLDWAGKLYGQSISRVTAGVKNLLSGGRQLGVTRVVDALMENKASPESEAFLTLDPRLSKGSVVPPRAPSNDAIVFMIGGGNYLEFGALQEYASRQQPAKQIIYGATEMLTGPQFLAQLSELGRKMGYKG